MNSDQKLMTVKKHTAQTEKNSKHSRCNPENIHPFQEISWKTDAAHKPYHRIFLMFIAAQSEASLQDNKGQYQQPCNQPYSSPHDFSRISRPGYISQCHRKKPKRQKHSQHLPAPSDPAG